MGMLDESWCASCGAGMHYTADESAMCGNCTEDSIIKYIQEHVLELKQSVEDANNDMPIQEDEYYEADEWYEGAIDALEHILAKFGANV